MSDSRRVSDTEISREHFCTQAVSDTLRGVGHLAKPGKSKLPRFLWLPSTVARGDEVFIEQALGFL